MVFTLLGYGQSQNENGARTLVVYFSWSGNTDEMATYMADQLGASRLRLEPVTPYPEEYCACGEVALQERDSDARSAITNLSDSLDQYDTIVLGYPIWWHTAPMIIGTFLESYDLSGKPSIRSLNLLPWIRSSSIIP